MVLRRLAGQRIASGGGSGDLRIQTDVDIGNNNLTLNGNRAVEVESLNGSGNITKKGTGPLTLSETNILSGNLDVSGFGNLTVNGVLTGGGGGRHRF